MKTATFIVSHAPVELSGALDRMADLWISLMEFSTEQEQEDDTDPGGRIVCHETLGSHLM